MRSAGTLPAITLALVRVRVASAMSRTMAPGRGDDRRAALLGVGGAEDGPTSHAGAGLGRLGVSHLGLPPKRSALRRLGRFLPGQHRSRDLGDPVKS